MKKVIFVLGSFILLVGLSACLLKQHQESKKEAAHSYVAIMPQPLYDGTIFPARSADLPVMKTGIDYANEYHPKVPAACRSDT